MLPSHRVTRRLSIIGVAVLAAVSVSIAPSGPATADTAPVDPARPTTVSADALPTVQINGVVWNQQIVGSTVYVGGNFTSARPAGAAPGSNEVARSHMLAYDLATGGLISGFAPVLNGQVKDLAVSPDQRTLYAAGQFTTVNGQTRYRVAAFDVATGALLPFRPIVNSSVNAVAATSSTVFLGGALTSVNSVSRSRVAAVSASTGATLPFTASVANGGVQALVIAPDQASIVIGGSFTSVNGSSNPGYGLARLNATTGANLPLPLNTYARNGGTDSAILSLETDGQMFYGTGYHFGGGGNIEGAFASDWATGGLAWVEDCHGDTYSAFPAGAAVYQASHKHYCGNGGGFPQTTPWSYYRATAVGKAAVRANTPDYYGYPDHRGRPAPAHLNWYPDVNAGSFTGKTQGPWTVHGNAQYVLLGGEFTQVNGQNQQGLVRFAVSSIAPDTQGPVLRGGSFPLRASSPVAGTVRLNWRSNHDRDNEKLTYSVYRSPGTSPIWQTTVATPFWRQQAMTFVDAGLSAGSSARYRVVATDPFGNAAASDWVTLTVSGDTVQSAYARRVLDDRPMAYWRMGESSGTAMADGTGFLQATASTGVSRGAAGAVAGDGDKAATFNGSTSGYASSALVGNAPETFSVEAWVRTTTTRGGKIVGFGNRQTGTSTGADRHLYMNNAGRLYFGMHSGSFQTVNSPGAYNDGAWHHVVGTFTEGTMRLFVDGAQVAQRSDVVYQRAYWGYWRIGGDRLAPWPSAPTSEYIAATIDEVAVYHHVLVPETVAAHHALGRSSTPPANQPPVAAFTAAPSGLSVQVDGSGSTDPDGVVASYTWDFGDGTSGSGASTTHTYAAAGTYDLRLTVTDDRGATGTTTREVTVTTPPPPGDVLARDAFARTVAGGWGSAEIGGPWTSPDPAAHLSVNGQAGQHTLAAGATARSLLDAVSSTSTEVAVTVTADKVPAGSGAFVHVQARRVTSTDSYAGRVRLGADGSVQLHVTRGNGTPVSGGVVSGLTFAAGDQLRVKVQVDGTGPTAVRAKVWKAGQPEPETWRASMAADTTASLQAPGSVGLVTYVFGTATNAPVVFGYDDLEVTPVG